MFKILGEKETEPHMYLTLSSYHVDGSITLVACREDGIRISRGNILTILQDGTIKLCGAINPETGFRLDKRGRVVIQNVE